MCTLQELLVQLLQEGDALYLDRGFRDLIEKLKEDFKLKTIMPNLLPKTQKQFSTLEANESRIYTKVR